MAVATAAVCRSVVSNPVQYIPLIIKVRFFRFIIQQKPSFRFQNEQCNTPKCVAFLTLPRSNLTHVPAIFWRRRKLIMSELLPRQRGHARTASILIHLLFRHCCRRGFFGVYSRCGVSWCLLCARKCSAFIRARVRSYRMKIKELVFKTYVFSSVF